MLICYDYGSHYKCDSIRKIYVYDTDDCTLELVPVHKAVDFIRSGGSIKCAHLNESNGYLFTHSISADGFVVKNELGCLVHLRGRNFVFWSSGGYFYKVNYIRNVKTSDYILSINDKNVNLSDLVSDWVDRVAGFCLLKEGLVLFVQIRKNTRIQYKPIGLDSTGLGVKCTYEVFRKQLMYG